MLRHLSYLGLTIVLVSFVSNTLAVQSSFPLPQSYPILWTKSTENFKFKDAISSLTIKFYSPCDFESGVINGTQAYFKSWCENEINSKLFIPLTDMCDSGAENRKRRALNAEEVQDHENKKSLFSENIGKINEIVGVIGNVGETILGLFGKAETKNYDDEMINLNSQVNSLNDRITECDNQIKIILAEGLLNSKKLTELKNQQKLHTKLLQELATVTKKLDKKIEETDDRVNFLENWKQSTLHDFGPTVTLTSKLTNYFEWCDKEIPEISRDWRAHKLNPNKFFTIFNMQNNNEILNRFKYVQPNSCHIDPIRNTAKFIFKFPETHDGLEAYTPHPFTLIEKIPGSNFGYRAEYIGPKAVINQKEIDCIVPVLYNFNALFPTEPRYCDPIPNTTVSKYWRKTCVPIHYSDPHEIIQIKRDELNLFIYCYGFQIKIFSRDFTECPSFVFSLKLGDKFTFRNGESEIIDYQHLSTISMDSLDTDYKLSQKINFHLMPNVLNMDLMNEKDFPPTIPCLDFQNMHTGSIPNLSDSSVITILGAISCILVLLLIAVIVAGVLYVKTRNRRNSSTADWGLGRRAHGNPKYCNVSYEKTDANQ